VRSVISLSYFGFIVCPNRPSVKHEYLAINLGLLEVTHPLRALRLLFLGHKGGLLDASNAPVLVTDPASRDCFGLSLSVAQNPATDHCAAVLIPLCVRLLWPNLKLKKEHRHQFFLFSYQV
jgi:hypothetical protein